MSKKYLDSAGLNKFAAMILSKFAAKNHSHSNATTNSAGFMSANDKVKLDGVAAGANKTIVDSTLSSTSVNAIQNKAVKTALDGKAASSHTHSTAQITGLDAALASKAPSSHSHSADNITSGVLPIGRGGTGSTNSVGAASTMINALEPGTAAPSDDDWYVAKYAADGNNTPVRRTHSALWSYIKAKCDGLYQPRGSYASSSHTHTIANVSNLQSTLDSKASVSHTHSNATATASGFMSNTDKAKLDSVSTGANKTIVDASFSATSTNPVQNKVVKAALDAKASSSHTHTTSQVSGLDSALAGKAPSSHTHTIAQVTNLQSQLDSKQPKGSYAAASHNHGTVTDNFTVNVEDTTTDSGWSMIGGNNGHLLKSIRTQAKAPSWLMDNFGAGIAFGGADTKGVMSVAYSHPTVRFAGGNGTKPFWNFDVSGTTNRKYNLDNMSVNGHSHDASAITSGTLPVSKGGTGANNAAGAVRSFFPNTGNLGFVATIGNDWSGGYRSNADLANDLYPTIKAKTDPVTTSGTGAAYTATVPCITSLSTGATFAMIPHATSTSTSPTLNINGLGAKPIRQRLSNSTLSTATGAAANWLAAGKPVEVMYDGQFWVVDFVRPNMASAYGVLPVANGGVPSCTTSDNGKILKVSNGVPLWSSLPSAVENLQIFSGSQYPLQMKRYGGYISYIPTVKGRGVQFGTGHDHMILQGWGEVAFSTTGTLKVGDLIVEISIPGASPNKPYIRCMITEPRFLTSDFVDSVRIQDGAVSWDEDNNAYIRLVASKSIARASKGTYRFEYFAGV